MRNSGLSFYKKTRKGFLREVFEWIITFGITILTTLFILANVFSLTQIKGESMESTFLDGDRVFNYKLGYNFTEPKQGDIVILDKLESKKGIIINTINEAKDIIDNISNRIAKKEEIRYIVKRVIAIPGDTIDIKEGEVYLNGEKLQEDYIKGQTFENSEVSYPLIIPEKKVFVLGDNRENSSDSRDLGLIDYEQIKGRISFRLFPFGRLGKVN